MEEDKQKFQRIFLTVTITLLVISSFVLYLGNKYVTYSDTSISQTNADTTGKSNNTSSEIKTIVNNSSYSNNDPYINWQQFIDKNNKISIKFPDGWTSDLSLDTTSTVEGTILSRFFSPQLNNGFFNYIVNSDYKNSADYISYIESNKSLSKYFSNIKKINVNENKLYNAVISSVNYRVYIFDLPSKKVGVINFSTDVPTDVQMKVINSL